MWGVWRRAENDVLNGSKNMSKLPYFWISSSVIGIDTFSPGMTASVVALRTWTEHNTAAGETDRRCRDADRAHTPARPHATFPSMLVQHGELERERGQCA